MGDGSIKYHNYFSFYNTTQLIDKYPLTSLATKSGLTSIEVASFCFPSGVKFRLIPTCAKEVAMKKGLIGKDGDKYQLHTVRKYDYLYDFGTQI